MNVLVNIGTVTVGVPHTAGEAAAPATPDSGDVAALRNELQRMARRVDAVARGGDAQLQLLRECYPLDPSHVVSRSWKLRQVHDDLVQRIDALAQRVAALETARNAAISTPQHADRHEVAAPTAVKLHPKRQQSCTAQRRGDSAATRGVAVA